jgi:recombination protein RecT
MTQRGMAATLPRPGEIVSPNRAASMMLQTLTRYEGQLKRALPSSLPPERFTRIVVTEFSKSASLRRAAIANPSSFLGAIMICAQWGLEPASGLGLAYLVPYKNEIQAIMGYQGKVELAMRSGRVVSVRARPVFTGDIFRAEYGLDELLIHTPQGEMADAALEKTYAVARLRGGEQQFEIAWPQDIDRARGRSASGSRGKGPWATDYVAMAMKTAVHKLGKLMPKSPAFRYAEMLDTEGELGRQQNSIYGAAVEEGADPTEVLSLMLGGDDEGGGNIADAASPGPGERSTLGSHPEG